MIKSEILAMKPSRELDRLVAQTMEPNPPPPDPDIDYVGEIIAGKSFYSPLGFWAIICEYDRGDVPEWAPRMLSTNIAAAWKVVDVLAAKDICITVQYFRDRWSTSIAQAPWYTSAEKVEVCEATPMEAICKASLLAMVPLG